MSDLIDRQAVIKAITNAADKWDCSDDYMRGIKAGIRMGTLISSVVPSAKPEIIHCRECKHCRRERDEESAKKFGQIYYCARKIFYCPTPDDYCSWAERREEG